MRKYLSLASPKCGVVLREAKAQHKAKSGWHRKNDLDASMNHNLSYHQSKNFYLMLYSPRVFGSNTALAVMVVVNSLCIQMGMRLGAQDLPTQYESPYLLGLRGILPSREGMTLGPVEGIKGGFGYGLAARATYDSNFSLDEDNPDSELTGNILPWINYFSDPEGDAPFSFTANYQPNIRAYLNNPDLNGVDHSGNVAMQVKGSKTLISAYMNYDAVSGTDRISGTFVNGTLLSTGVSGTYQLASRTSVYANCRYSMSDYGSSSLVGSDMYSAEIGGYWSASERLSYGPSIRYNRDVSDSAGTRDAWSLNMQTRYLMANKLQFVGSLGVQSATNSNDNGGTTLGMTGSLSANYAITEKLSWLNSARYETVPSATDANYMIDNLMISTALRRQLLRGEVGIGLDMNISKYVEVGPVGTQLGNEDYLSAVLSYRRKLFMERLDFDSSLRYGMNHGRRDWSQLQLSVGVQFQF